MIFPVPTPPRSGHLPCTSRRAVAPLWTSVSDFSSPSTDSSGRGGTRNHPPPRRPTGRPPPPTPPRTLSGSHHLKDGPTLVSQGGVTGRPIATAAHHSDGDDDDDDAEAVWRWRFKKRWAASTRRVALGLTASGGGGGLADALADDESRPPTRHGSGVLPQLPAEDW